MLQEEGLGSVKRSLADAARERKVGGEARRGESNGELLGEGGGATDFKKFFIRKNSKHTQ